MVWREKVKYYGQTIYRALFTFSFLLKLRITAGMGQGITVRLHTYYSNYVGDYYLRVDNYFFSSQSVLSDETDKNLNKWINYKKKTSSKKKSTFASPGYWSFKLEPIKNRNVILCQRRPLLHLRQFQGERNISCQCVLE